MSRIVVAGSLNMDLVMKSPRVPVLGETIPAGPFVVVCAHGTRSAEVVRWLTGRGVQARYLGGGMSWRVRAM